MFVGFLRTLSGHVTLLFAVEASSSAFQVLHLFWVHPFEGCFADFCSVYLHGIRVFLNPLSSTVFVFLGGSDEGEVMIFSNCFRSSMVATANLLLHLFGP